MKKNYVFALFLMSTFSLSYAQDTLRNFNPLVDTPVAESYPSNNGYYSGHNNYGDEEFGEKYEINGTANVLGVIAIHSGVAGTSTMSASYKIYDVAGSGLPGSQKALKSIPNNDIPVDGSNFAVLFDNPVSVNGQFFVSFMLGDYSHTNPGTKKIALTHSPDGIRPSSDFSVFGRNVVRWHTHGGAPAWKDYRTENFEGYEPAIHFSLFPIVALGTSSVIEFGEQSYMAAAFPNPSTGGFTVPVSSLSGTETNFQLLDINGKLIIQKNTQLSPGENNYYFSTENVVPGTYVLMVKSPEGTAAQRVIIN